MSQMETIKKREISASLKSLGRSGAILPQSHLLGVARQMQSDANIWNSILLREKRIDQDLFERMLAAKTAIISAVPTNVVDALVIAGTAQCIAEFMLRLSGDGKYLDPDNAALLASSAGEISTAMGKLQDYLEATAGCSLQSLGLFQDGVSLQ